MGTVRGASFDESEALKHGAGQRLRFFHALGFLAGAANADSQEHLSFEHVERAGNRTGDPVSLLAKTANGTWLAALPLAFGIELLFVFARDGFFVDLGRVELLLPKLPCGQRDRMEWIGRSQEQAN